MPEWLIAVVVAVITSGLGYLAIRYQYREDKTALAKQLAEMAKQMAIDLADERNKRRHLEQLYDNLMDGVRKLIEQLKDAGITPCWEPGDPTVPQRTSAEE
jgi:hypothetical protein